MDPISLKNISGVDALKLARQGQQLQCPVTACRAIIKTVPEEWRPGMPLHGLQCSKNFKHYMLVAEDEYAMKEIRRSMHALINKV